MVILHDDGSTHDLPTPDLSLQGLQALVGGYIEFVTFRDGSALVVNEEGLLEGLPFNAVATLLARAKGRPVNIVGTALFLSRAEVERSDEASDEES